jgi:thiamine-phosphate pyrophosphorylase
LSTRCEPAAFAGLHVLVDDDPRWPHDPAEQAAAACRGGAAVVQLRAKHAGDARAAEWGRAIRALTRADGVRFVVNDRFDLALLSEADAVHLGQDDLPPGALPAAARARLAIGRSTHTHQQAEAAIREDADYIAFGPVFDTASKASPYAARGLAALREIVALAGARPVIAIGGVSERNAAELAAAGARGIAVISAVAGAEDPAAAARKIAASFDAGLPAREGCA